MSGEIICTRAIGGSLYAAWESRLSAAIKTKRHYVGYDINEEYVKLTERRIFSTVLNAPKLFDSAEKR
jgi:hypothetical protein